MRGETKEAQEDWEGARRGGWEKRVGIGIEAVGEMLVGCV
jgi:hypothetical protein